MTTVTASPHRHGMVFVDDSGEYDCLSGQPASPAASSGADSESDLYAEVYSDDSYHSDGEEFAEYWDPYCKFYKSFNIRKFHKILWQIISVVDCRCSKVQIGKVVVQRVILKLSMFV